MQEIYAGDCCDGMRNLAAESIDLVVTSPPYDDLRSYKGFSFDFPGVTEQLWRVMKPGGVIVWVVGDATIDGSETGTSFRQALGFKEIGFKIFDTMIYHKTGTAYRDKVRYVQVFEYMFVFSKGLPKTFNPICDVPKLWEGSWGRTTRRQKDGGLKVNTSENCGKGKSGRATDGRYGMKMRDNIWRIVNGKNFAHSDKLAVSHPATFPEALARDHILSWSNRGDLVLDPFCGSGTTLKMAHLYGRQFIGIDISEEYCLLANSRVEAVTEEQIIRALAEEQALKEIANGTKS